MQILPLSFEDCESVAEIEQLCFSDPWSKESIEGELSLDFAFYFAAKEGNKLYGYVGVHNICGVGEITMVAVHPSYRRRGIAEKLINMLIEFEKQQNILKVNLEVRESNVPARELYAKLGFKEDGFRKNYYTAPRENAVLMSIELSRKDEKNE